MGSPAGTADPADGSHAEAKIVASETVDAALAASPAGAALAAYRAAVWSDPYTDPALLAACRDRLASRLGVAAGASPVASGAADPSPRVQAAVAFAEQWVLDPHGMTDDDCARLREELSDAECAAFTMGLALVEAELRAAAALVALTALDPRG